jgi:SagB-type dehydrogenase family enzyme
LGARVTKSGRKPVPARLSAKLVDHVTLEAHANGDMFACFDGHSVGLGKLSAGAVGRAQSLRNGLPLGSFEPDGQNPDKEIHLLVRRLAAHGLLEYRLGHSPDAESQVVIEPQTTDYWPRTPQLRDADVLVLSRFAYMRRRGNEMVLESPRAGALFRILDPKIAATIATLSTPQRVKKLRGPDGFEGLELAAVLLDCQMLFKVGRDGDDGLRPTEGDESLVLWDFHDLLFHGRSTEGRHANPIGGVYPYADMMSPLPAVRPVWPGEKIDLRGFTTVASQAGSRTAALLRERHSTRSFDDRNPLTLAELAQFLDGAARVHSQWSDTADLGDDSPVVEYAARPYPSGGGSYALELYLAVDKCEGLARGFYHYDAGAHALVPIAVRTQELEALLRGAEFAMGASAPPQIVITIAARFGRTSWKYSSIAYALILKDAGVLTQTLSLMATGMGLGGCAIGTVNINLFAKMTGIEFHIEGPVGQFALGRGMKPVGGDEP